MASSGAFKQQILTSDAKSIDTPILPEVVALTDDVLDSDLDGFFGVYIKLHTLAAKGVTEFYIKDHREADARAEYDLLIQLESLFRKFPFLRPKNTILHFFENENNLWISLSDLESRKIIDASRNIGDIPQVVGGDIDPKPSQTIDNFKMIYRFCIDARYKKADQRKIAKQLKDEYEQHGFMSSIKGLSQLGKLEEAFERLRNPNVNAKNEATVLPVRVAPAKHRNPVGLPPRLQNTADTPPVAAASASLVGYAEEKAPLIAGNTAKNSSSQPVSPSVAAKQPVHGAAPAGVDRKLQISADHKTPALTTVISPDKQTALTALRQYEEKRKAQGEYGYYGIFACLTSLTKTVKLSAVDKIIKHLEDKPFAKFTNIELEALRDERLGAVVKVYLIDKGLAPEQLLKKINQTEAERAADFVNQLSRF